VPESPAPGEAPIDAEALYQVQKKEAIMLALTMARMNRPAEVWADFAIENVETANNPVTARLIQEIMTSENFGAWFTELEKLEPTIVTSRGWFEVFWQTIRETVSAKAEGGGED
jgi:hypothetical protein